LSTAVVSSISTQSIHHSIPDKSSQNHVYMLQTSPRIHINTCWPPPPHSKHLERTLHKQVS
jgi:hypothetical protein